MEITEAMRLRARDFGAQMPDYLAALDRIKPAPRGGEYRGGRQPVAGVVLGAGPDRVEVVVERHAGVVRPAAYATSGDDALPMEPADALRSGWDLIAAGDAVRFGWLS